MIVDTFPWECRREIGVLRAFTQNLALSVRAPAQFFALPSRDASVWPAIVYGFVFELVVALATFAYAKLFGEAELRATLGPVYPQLEQALPGATAKLDSLMSASTFASLLMTPFGYLLELYTAAALTWVGLRLGKSLTTSFGHIVRLLAYAGWVRLFGLLAVTGDLVLSLLSGLVTLGVASYVWWVLVRSSQRIDARRTVLASLYGTLVGVGVSCIVVVPPTVVAVLWLASQLANR